MPEMTVVDLALQCANRLSQPVGNGLKLARFRRRCLGLDDGGTANQSLFRSRRCRSPLVNFAGHQCLLLLLYSSRVWSILWSVVEANPPAPSLAIPRPLELPAKCLGIGRDAEVHRQRQRPAAIVGAELADNAA